MVSNWIKSIRDNNAYYLAYILMLIAIRLASSMFIVWLAMNSMPAVVLKTVLLNISYGIIATICTEIVASIAYVQFVNSKISIKECFLILTTWSVIYSWVHSFFYKVVLYIATM